MNFRHNKQSKGTPVATFGDDSITVEELKQKFSEMSPFIRTRYQTIEQRKEYVDTLARFELLAAEAHKRGLQNDPEVVDAAKNMMVRKLLQKEEEEKKTVVPDAEIADYYEKHKADYVKPETTRLSNIFFAAAKEDAAARAKKRKLAEEVLAKAKAKPPTDSASFIALVREYSEDLKTKSLDGDMRFLAEADLKTQYGPEVASAVASLSKLGDLSGVVETPQGFHLLRFQGRQAAINHGLDQVKTQIDSRIKYDRRQQSFNALVQKLKDQAGYKLDEANLAKVEIDTKPPSPPPGAPPLSPPPGAPPSVEIPRAAGQPPSASQPGSRPATTSPPPAMAPPAAKPPAQPGVKPAAGH